MKKLLNLYPSFILGYSLIPLAVGAQGVTPLSTTLTNIKITLNTIIGILFIIATIVFIWGVIQFIASAGDEAKRTKAKGIMTWGIVGLAVMSAAWGIVNVLTEYFGVRGVTTPVIPQINP